MTFVMESTIMVSVAVHLNFICPWFMDCLIDAQSRSSARCWATSRYMPFFCVDIADILLFCVVHGVVTSFVFVLCFAPGCPVPALWCTMHVARRMARAVREPRAEPQTQKTAVPAGAAGGVLLEIASFVSLSVYSIRTVEIVHLNCIPRHP